MIRNVRLNQVSKHFPGGITACEDVTVEAASGEVHAVLGENGAGKTTLMRMLAGLVRPDSGAIELDGRPVGFRNPSSAKRHGVGMVHQHFSLVSALTVGENLALSHTRRGFGHWPRSWNRHIKAKATQLGFDIRPDAYVRDISLGEQQRVEIFRLIVEGASVLILDEPTSILAPQEADILFNHVRRFADAGHIVFLVTHKIHHMRRLADHVSILRRGKLVATHRARDLDDEQLAQLMVGEAFEAALKTECARPRVAHGRLLLKVTDLSTPPRHCPRGLQSASFELRSGEILGVGGISGNGQDELIAAITRSIKSKGEVQFEGQNSDKFERQSVGFIPADRTKTGVAATLSLEENLALLRFRQRPFSKRGLLCRRAMRDHARSMIDAYDIRPSAPAAAVRTFSGGNIQKILLARELEGESGVLFAVNPTSGLDMATVQLVHRQLLQKAKQGAGILLVSEDLDELFLLCDRLMILRHGKIQGIFPTASVTKNKAGMLMTGGPSQPIEAAAKKVNQAVGHV